MTQPTAFENFVSYAEEMTEFDAVHLSVSKQAVVHGLASYSKPGMPLRCLGWYEIALAREDPDFVALARSVPGFKASIARRPPWMPRMGRLSRTIVVTESGREEVLSLDNDADPSPAEEKFLDSIERLFRRVADSPRIAFCTTATLGAGEARRGDELTATLTFVNPGKLPVEIPTPALAGKPPWKVLRLNFWKPGVDDDGQPSWEFETSVDLRGEFLVGEHEALRAEPKLLTIDPGARLIVRTKFRLPGLKPSSYKVEAFFVTARRSDEVPQQGDRRIYGEFHADPVDLVVTKRRLGR